VDGDLARALGERVRFARQANHQTQAVVAGLSGITTDYLYQIERGKKLPAVPVLVQLAEVLRVSVSELLGETPSSRRILPPLEAGAAIHRALTRPPLDGDMLPTSDLREQIHAAWHTWQNSPRRYSKLGTQLPHLITDTERLVRHVHGEQGTERRQAHGYAVDLYGLVRTVAKRVGRTDLALVAADRGVRAAQTAGDPIRLASARWNLAHVLLAQGQPEGAEAISLHAAESLDSLTGDSLDALALQGSLRLLTAVAAVRLGDVWTARDRVREVVPMAERTGERNVCWTVFGPTNVAMYAVSVEVEAGVASEGLRLAEKIEPDPGLSIERRVAFRLEQARGYTQRQDYSGALVMLQAVSGEAPEDVKYRPAARAALSAVVHRARGSVARQAAQLASRVGISIT
jgi:transcriptional regulator with XRE-family HTH domain